MALAAGIGGLCAIKVIFDVGIPGGSPRVVAISNATSPSMAAPQLPLLVKKAPVPKKDDFDSLSLLKSMAVASPNPDPMVGLEMGMGTTKKLGLLKNPDSPLKSRPWSRSKQEGLQRDRWLHEQVRKHTLQRPIGPRYGHPSLSWPNACRRRPQSGRHQRLTSVSSLWDQRPMA